jgi:hypothetical protein
MFRADINKISIEHFASQVSLQFPQSLEQIIMINFILLCLLAPLNITQSLTDTNVLLGQNGTLQITCDAFPAPKVTWYEFHNTLP